MKRALDVLQEDAWARAQDELLRAQLEQRELVQNAAEKRQKKEQSQMEKWRKQLAKWDEVGVCSIGGSALTLPVLAPLGPFLTSLLCHFTFFLPILGGTMDMGRVGRAPPPLKCLDECLPLVIWDRLVDATNSFLARQVSTSSLIAKRTYGPTTVAELRKVFFARMDMIARGVPTIEHAYKSVVRLPPPPPPPAAFVTEVGSAGMVPTPGSLLSAEWASACRHCRAGICVGRHMELSLLSWDSGGGGRVSLRVQWGLPSEALHPSQAPS